MGRYNPQEKIQCSKCSKGITKVNLSRHNRVAHGKPKLQKTMFCPTCHEKFKSRYALSMHRRMIHDYTKIVLENTSINLQQEFGKNDELLRELSRTRHLLVDNIFYGRNISTYNFFFKEFDYSDFEKKLHTVFTDLQTATKLNVAFGYVLKSLEGEYRYYYAQSNASMLALPMLVRDQEDLNKIVQEFRNMDIFESLSQERPDTKWRFYCVTNLTVFAYHLKSIPIACSANEIPGYLLHNKNIYTLQSNRNFKQYNDNKCNFRAIAFHKNNCVQSDKYESDTNDLAAKFEKLFGPLSEDGVSESDVPKLEQIAELNIVIYSCEKTENSKLLGILSRRSLNKFAESIFLLRYLNHVCYIKNPNVAFSAHCCTNCFQNFKTKQKLEKHLGKCDELVKHVYPGGVYQLKKTVFEELEEHGINVDKNLQLFSNVVVFDFESYCDSNYSTSERVKNTETTDWIGKHVPISVSIASNLLGNKTIFICDKDPLQLIYKFCGELNKLQRQSAIETRLKLSQTFDQLIDRIKTLSTTAEGEDNSVSYQKTCITKILHRLEKYADGLPCFGFNSSRYDLNLMREYLPEYIMVTLQIQPEVLKRGNQYVSFSFDNLHFLDILNFLGGATNLDSFLKAYGASEQKGYFPYEWFDNPAKLNVKKLPPPECFYSKLKGHNVLSEANDKFKKLIDQGHTEREVMNKLKIKERPNTQEENYQMLNMIWEIEQMQTFEDYLRWYNDKDVLPTLEALQNMLNFYHTKNVDMLKQGLTLPSLANRLLHQSTNALFYGFGYRDIDLNQKVRSEIVGGPSLVFTRYAKANCTKIRNSENVCKTIVGVDASQLYPYAMCQQMPTGPYTRWDLKDNKFYPKSLHRFELELKVLSFMQSQRPACSILSLVTHGKQKKIGPYYVDGFCAHCNTVFEVMGCFYHCCPCIQHKLTLDDIEENEKRVIYDEIRTDYIKQCGYILEKIWECEWNKEVKENKNNEQSFLKRHFPKKYPLTESKLLEKVFNKELFGIVECDIHVPEVLKEKFKDFPPIFKNEEVGRKDIGSFMQNTAEEHGFLPQPRRMLISSFFLKKGLLITPLLNYLVQLGLKITRVYSFVQYEPQKCFERFVDDVVEARREGDKNKDSTVKSETMKLIGNSSYGYQIMDRSKHSVTKYANATTVHDLINKNLFKSCLELNNEMYEVTLSCKKIKHEEPIIVGFFILQYAKLRMLELYYNFLDKFCDKSLYEEIEMDTDSLYLALARDNITDCITEEKLYEWQQKRRSDCGQDFEADSQSNFFPRTCCEEHVQFDKRTPGLFKEEHRCSEMIALCSKTYCCFDVETNSIKLSSKGLNKNNIEEPAAKYRKVLFENGTDSSKNRGFRVAADGAIHTYQQTKRGLSCFYPKRIVLEDGIHTKPLNL